MHAVTLTLTSSSLWSVGIWFENLDPIFILDEEVELDD
jgi:hypothetical protein